MRRIGLSLCLLTLALPGTALADDGVPAPASHGADPTSIDAGPEASSGARASNSARLPTNWCGDELTTDETRNELPNGEHRYHAIYAVPSDAPSRLTQMAGQIQTDAMRASSLIEQLHGRAIRYDMGTACGSQYLDITVVRLAETTAQLESIANSSTGTLDAVAGGLEAAGFEVIKSGDSFAVAQRRNRNWIVWLDGPGPSGACGQAMLYDDARRSQENFNNLGGKLAVVFRNDTNRFCGSNSVRHEIAHNLGAVVSDAPNSSGGHCTDAIEDTMCLPGSPERASGEYHALWFDYGNDDYWDPAGGALPWWTVNLNRFVCADANCNLPPGYTPPPAPPADNGSSAGREPSARRRARVKLSARRYGHNRWKLAVRVRGRGSGVVAVSCRTSRRARSSTVWSRRTEMPRTLRKRVRCASRPRVTAWYEDAGTSARARKSASAGERWRTAGVRASRSRSGSWRLSVRVRGRGSATVRVSCPSSRRASRVVWSREARGGRTHVARVRCKREPRLSVS